MLVIGGSGFMGSHTADALSESGYQVTIYDCVVSKWLRSDQYMLLGDLMDSTKLSVAINNTDIVYHFAGIADIGEAKDRPYETIDANVMGVTKILDLAVKSNVKKLIYASSMYVYSKHGSFYRASKQAAEIIIEAYHEQFNLDFTLLRYGSLYGPRSQKWNGLKHFATELITNNKLDYNGNGKEVREYIHVHDAARLSVDILDDKHNNSAITITGQQSIKMEDLFLMLIEIEGNNKAVTYHGDDIRVDHYGNTPYRYTPKTAKKLVPFEFVDLGQGLLDLIEEIHIEIENNEY